MTKIEVRVDKMGRNDKNNKPFKWSILIAGPIGENCNFGILGQNPDGVLDPSLKEIFPKYEDPGSFGLRSRADFLKGSEKTVILGHF